MIEVIPAIIPKNIQEVEEKIRLVEPYVTWVQLDIMDGVFVPNATWNNPAELDAQDYSVFLEAHLMVTDPANQIDGWIAAGIKRVIVHIEAVEAEKSHTKNDPLRHQVVDMSEKVHKAGTEFALAVNPETPLSVVEEFLEHCDMVLVMAVTPGFGGQKFREEVLQKIRDLREKNKRIKIEIDGGINPETARKCAEAGADILVAGSYIFNSANVGEAIERLRETATEIKN